MPFAIFTRKHGMTDGTPEHWGYYYGVIAVNFVVWHVFCIAGAVLGNFAPTSWGLDLAAALALIAVMVPMLLNRPAILGMIVTAVVAVVTVRVPLKLGLLIAIICGIATCLAAEAILERRSERDSLSVANDHVPEPEASSFCTDATSLGMSASLAAMSDPEGSVASNEVRPA